MSRVIGLLLLLVLLGAALLSMGILTWVWISSSNDNNNTPPKPSVQIYFSQPVAFTLVDSRWQSFENEVACA